MPGEIRKKNGETVFVYLAGEGFDGTALLVDTEGQIRTFGGRPIAGSWTGATKAKLAGVGYDNIAAVETEVGNYRIGQVIPNWEEYEIIPY